MLELFLKMGDSYLNDRGYTVEPCLWSHILVHTLSMISHVFEW